MKRITRNTEGFCASYMWLDYSFPSPKAKFSSEVRLKVDSGLYVREMFRIYQTIKKDVWETCKGRKKR